jgi:hypothetical protein
MAGESCQGVEWGKNMDMQERQRDVAYTRVALRKPHAPMKHSNAFDETILIEDGILWPMRKLLRE